jgi:DNA-binding response OmpR family regulator
LLLATAGPAEVDVRLRLAMSPSMASAGDPLIRTGNIVIDEAGYSAKLNGAQLDLTYTEFELLKYLAQHPGRVFSRQQLLSDVWGYDYYGGTRTVDVHVRRLRAKLGPEYESMIGTVRNVGYRFVTPTEEPSGVSAG